MFTPWLCFEFAGLTSTPLVFTRPRRIVAAYQARDVVPALRVVQRAVNGGATAAGYVAYEAAPAFDAAMQVSGHDTPPDFPLLWFGLFDAPAPTALPAPSADAHFDAWQPQTDIAAYRRSIAVLRAAIGQGDAYQVNYTLRLQSVLRGDAWTAYRRLLAAQHPAYGAYLDMGRWRILSASPELFFHKQGDHIVTRPMKGTAPRSPNADDDRRQAQTLAASEKNRAENLMIVDLLRNDLGRVADTGSVRVSRLFDVERYPTVWQMTSTIEAGLPPQTTLETLFGALFPCGSVTGAPKISAMQQIARLEDAPRNIYCGAIGYVTPNEAVFSVAIRTLLLDAQSGQATYGTGGGITWDSDADDEYAEAIAKTAILHASPPPADTPYPAISRLEIFQVAPQSALPSEPSHGENASARDTSPFPINGFPVAAFAGHPSVAVSSVINPLDALLSDTPAPLPNDTPFELLETLRLEAGRYWLLARHLERMEASARYFGYTFSKATVEARLLEEARAAGEGAWRVRCLLDAAGLVRVERYALDADARFPLPVALALRPVSRDDIFLRHKTTRRDVYDRCFADAQQAWADAYDALLWNREGELTEATRGNVVVEWRGRLVTPPLACGLLPGVLRAELLARGDIQERIVTRDDLAAISNVWLINSVRGWLPARLLNKPLAVRPRLSQGWDSPLTPLPLPPP